MSVNMKGMNAEEIAVSADRKIKEYLKETDNFNFVNNNNNNNELTVLNELAMKYSQLAAPNNKGKVMEEDVVMALMNMEMTEVGKADVATAVADVSEMMSPQLLNCGPSTRCLGLEEYARAGP